MSQKLILERDVERYNYDDDASDDEGGALCDPKDNRKKVEEFLKEAVEASGYTPRKKVDRSSYDTTSRVFIKELGGKFFLEAIDDFGEAGGEDDDDEIEIKRITLGCSDYRASYNVECADIEYKKFEEILEKLPKHLNMFAGGMKTLTKGEAKKNAA